MIVVQAGMLSKTDTPMGRRLSEQPGNLQTLGCDRRASTLRGRGRVIREFLNRLAIYNRKPFLTELTDSIESEERLSEPCNRGAIEHTQWFHLLGRGGGTGRDQQENRTASRPGDVRGNPCFRLCQAAQQASSKGCMW